MTKSTRLTVRGAAKRQDFSECVRREVRICMQKQQPVATRRAMFEQLGGFNGTIGLAHTRWATHGSVTEANAHPHRDDRAGISVWNRCPRSWRYFLTAV